MHRPKTATIATPQTMPSSIAFPETPERRAEITRQIQAATGLDEKLLERVVRAFYNTARQDPVIGHLFDDVQDWEAHIARITAFWSSVALMSGRYHGNPMAPHLKLPLEPPHFVRWLSLFEQTVRDLCAEAGADLLLEKARRIAQSLQLGIEAKRGLLPMRWRPA
jgi:hemoglobin